MTVVWVQNFIQVIPAQPALLTCQEAEDIGHSSLLGGSKKGQCSEKLMVLKGPALVQANFQSHSNAKQRGCV